VLPRLAIAAAVVGLLYAMRPGVVENGARSWRVWVAVLLALVAARLVAVAVRRTTGRARTASLAGNLVLALIGAVLLAPSFQQRTADEPFPAVAAAASGSPPSAAASVSPSTPPPTTPATSPPAPSPPAPSPPAPAPAGPRPVAAGELDGVGHSASGRVVLYAVEERLVVRFEDVDIEGTPGPVVHLVRSGGRTPSQGVSLGELTAERGSFSYTLPAGVDAAADWTVLVWCRPYETPVAAADLSAV
jgi:hypothetical protein